jgi:hypothetical protein
VKKSLSLTLLIITGFALFSIASCGSSTQPQAKSNIPEAAKQIAKADYTYDQEEAASAEKSMAAPSIFTETQNLQITTISLQDIWAIILI